MADGAGCGGAAWTEGFQKRGAARARASTTAKPISPEKLGSSKPKTFWSPLTSATPESPASSRDLALNWSEASSWMSSTPAISASTATMSRSYSVVVGPSRLSVSERIAHSSMPAIGTGGRRACARKLCAMIVDIEPHGRMSM